MARPYALGLLSLALFIHVGSAAWASLSEYRFSSSSGTFQQLTSYYSSLGSYNSYSSSTGQYGDSATGGWYSIGWTFRFDCSDYRYFSTSANGQICLTYSASGTRPAGRYDDLTNAPRYPIIAPLWQWQHLYSGYCMTTRVNYYRLGSSPNRSLVVEWQTQLAYNYNYYWNGCTNSMFQYQARLYEGSNKVEFHYGRISGAGVQTSASIGMTAGPTNFISVSPGATNSVSSTVANNNIDVYQGYPAAGTIYTFDPSGETYTGLTGPGNGGTPNVVSGDTLFSGFGDMVGNRSIYTPLSVTAACASPGANYNFRITADSTNAYTFDPSGTRDVTVYLRGATYTPRIAFTPVGTGMAYAKLTVRNTSTNVSRTYTLAASGQARIIYIGDPGEGGTPAAADGDRFLTTIELPRLASGTYRPVRIDNINAAPNFSTAPVAFTFAIDSSGQASSQYFIVDPGTGQPVSSLNVALGPGETFVPQILFTPLGAGQQLARLTITNSDGENRTYGLGAYSIAPGGIFSTSAGLLGESAQFDRTITCVGSDVLTVPVTITSSGHRTSLEVYGVDVYLLDTVVRQGTPPLDLKRDELGRLIPQTDYFFSEQPASVSGSPPVSFPIVLDPGENRTIYLNYIGSYPGKRFARIFIRSNAQNFTGLDTSGALVPGLVMFHALSASVGGRFAADQEGARIRPVVFPQAKIRSWSDTTLVVHNAGWCDLRIKKLTLAITGGDVRDFSLLSVFPNTPVDGATGDYVIPPWSSDTITLRFAPSRPGTRMATLRIATNDSTVILPGLTARGEAYIDLHGYGRASLEGRDLTLSPVVIGGSESGTAVFENVVNTSLTVSVLDFEGGDLDQFTAVGWPSLPIEVRPTQKLELGVLFTPTGMPGLRTTSVIAVTSTGDTCRIVIRAEAGTQDLVVTPPSLFENVAIQVGESRRETVIITNTGTLPIRLERVEIVGADATNYRMGYLPRLDLGPGATEYLEVTFAPSTQAQSSAELQVVARGVVHSVALGGVGMRVWGGGDPTTEGKTGGDLAPPRDPMPVIPPSLR